MAHARHLEEPWQLRTFGSVGAGDRAISLAAIEIPRFPQIVSSVPRALARGDIPGGQSERHAVVGEPGTLLVTYAANSFDFWELFRPEGADLYWPRFVRLTLEPAP